MSQDLLCECNMWNPLLTTVADPVSGPVLADLVPDAEWGQVALTCHFAIDLLCDEMHALSERGPPAALSCFFPRLFFRESGDGLSSRGACCFPDFISDASLWCSSWCLVLLELSSAAEIAEAFPVRCQAFSLNPSTCDV